MGAEGVVVLGPHPGDVLAHLLELLAQGLRVAADGADRALQAEEPLDLLPQLERRVDLVAELAHPPLEAVDLGAGLGDPLDLRLRGREPGRGAFHPGHLPLDRLAALAQRVQFLGPLQDRRQRAKLLDDAFRPGDEGSRGRA